MRGKITEKSILELARNFMASRVLISGAELDIFTLIAKEPLTAEEIAAAAKAKLRGIVILLDALSALGFLVKKDGRYHTEPSVAPLLSSTAPGSILPMVLHMGTVWQNWSQITDIVLGKTTPGLRTQGAFRFKTRHGLAAHNVSDLRPILPHRSHVKNHGQNRIGHGG